MKQFVVPQFIDVEDKIIGPLTTRQFLILLGGGLLIFLEFKLADFGLFLLEGILTLAISGTFAFMKVNGMPFHCFVMNLFRTIGRPKVRIWQRQINEAELRTMVYAPVAVVKAAPARVKPQFNKSRLQELALIVDTGGAYRGEEEKFTASLNHLSK